MKIQPFELERFFAKYEFSAPYLLGSSDCESFSIQEILDLEPGAENAFKKCWLGYTESAGHPDLRQAISNIYESCESQHVLVHSGAEEAIFIFMNVMLKPDDHVIVQDPCYQSLYQIAHDLGCRVSKWTTYEENGWELDLDQLETLIEEDTKAVIINQPHNPTGYLMSAEKQQQLIDILQKRNLLLFSDEVYRELEHDPKDRLPAACDLYDNAVSIGVMSKTYGLAGLRIGWAVTQNEQIFKEMATFKDYTSICNSAPSEYLALVALMHRQRIVDRNLKLTTGNLAVLNQFFHHHSNQFNWKPPIAGSIAFPSITAHSGVEDFCVSLVQESGVLLIPSPYFQYGDRHFRIGFGRRNLPECVEQLDRYLKKHPIV